MRGSMGSRMTRDFKGLSKLKYGFAIYWDKGGGRKIFKEKIEGLFFGACYIWSIYNISKQGDNKYAVGYANLKFKETIWTKNTNITHITC